MWTEEASRYYIVFHTSVYNFENKVKLKVSLLGHRQVLQEISFKKIFVGFQISTQF